MNEESLLSSNDIKLNEKTQAEDGWILMEASSSQNEDLPNSPSVPVDGVSVKRIESPQDVEHPEDGPLSDAILEWSVINEEDYVPYKSNLSWREILMNKGHSGLSAFYNLLRANSASTTLSTDASIHLLGVTYAFANRTRELQTRQLEAFMRDFVSRTWFTYRRAFQPIPPANLQTDMGWGCLHRAGQMLLAEALSRHFLGRHWRVDHAGTALAHKTIISWFLDRSSKHVPYSIHNLCQVGQMFGTQPGQWFSPTLIAHCIAFLAQSHSPDDFQAIVCANAAIGTDDVRAAAAEAPRRLRANTGVSENTDDSQEREMQEDAERRLMESIAHFARASTDALPRPRTGSKPIDLPRISLSATDSIHPLCESWYGDREQARLEQEARAQPFRPLLIMVPIRCGIDSFNVAYAAHIKALLQMPQLCGLIGGHPDRAYFIVGCQADSLIYLDPHYVQEVVDCPSNNRAQLNTDSFHCTAPRFMPLSECAPSLVAAFFCTSLDQFKDLCIRIEIQQQLGDPLITLTKTNVQSNDANETLSMSLSESDLQLDSTVKKANDS